MVTAHSGALGGGARRLRGAVRRLRRARGADARRAGRHDGAVLVAPPRSAWRRRSRACTTAVASGRCSSISPPISACPFASVERRDDRADRGHSRSRHGVRQPPRRLGNRHRRRRIFRDAFAAFADDPAVSASVFCVDMTLQGEPYDEGYLRCSRARRSRPTDGTVLRAVEPGERGYAGRGPDASRRGHPGARGNGERSSRARASVGRRRVPCATARRRRRGGAIEAVRARWRDRLATGVPLSELDGLALLADYGLETVAARPASSTAERGRARDGDRLPGGAEDGGAGHHAQVRRRRGASRAAPTRMRCGVPTRTSWTARSGCDRRGDGPGGRRDGARCDHRPDLRPARPGRAPAACSSRCCTTGRSRCPSRRCGRASDRSTAWRSGRSWMACAAPSPPTSTRWPTRSRDSRCSPPTSAT